MCVGAPPRGGGGGAQILPRPAWRSLAARLYAFHPKARSTSHPPHVWCGIAWRWPTSAISNHTASARLREILG